jgi:5'-nucleotidase/UDP-sugar diphosphatase
MRRSLFVNSLLGLLLAGAVSVSSPAQSNKELVILHFNDFHGQVQPLKGRDGAEAGGLTRLAGLAEKERSAQERAWRPVLLLFAGDAFTGTAFSTLFQGAPEFAAFQQMGVSAMVPGNHEWDFGPAVLAARVRSVRFPVLAANVKPAGGQPGFLKPYATIRAGGLKVGIIGVTTAGTPLTTAPGNTRGYAFSDPVEAVGKALRHGDAENWDAVIVLSHCGFEVDRAIARKYPALSLIVGGHDHKELDAPWVENGVPIVQAGDRGRFLGEVQLFLGPPARPAKGRLLPVDSGCPADPRVASLLAGPLEQEKVELGTILGTLPEALSGDRNLLRTAEAPIGDLLADAMREASGAEVAFVNGGAIRAGLPKGPVKGTDLYACLPFFDSLVTCRLTGEQIRRLLDRCAAMPLVDAPGGFLQVSGLSAVYENGKAVDVSVAGKPIEPDREYRVACTHFLLSGGDGLVEFTQAKDVRDWGLSLQELMRRQLVRKDLKLPEAGNRIRREIRQ